MYYLPFYLESITFNQARFTGSPGELEEEEDFEEGDNNNDDDDDADDDDVSSNDNENVIKKKKDDDNESINDNDGQVGHDTEEIDDIDDPFLIATKGKALVGEEYRQMLLANQWKSTSKNY